MSLQKYQFNRQYLLPATTIRRPMRYLDHNNFINVCLVSLWPKKATLAVHCLEIYNYPLARQSQCPRQNTKNGEMLPRISYIINIVIIIMPLIILAIVIVREKGEEMQQDQKRLVLLMLSFIRYIVSMPNVELGPSLFLYHSLRRWSKYKRRI